ncbi:MAG: hypothetical protein LBI70_01425 [Rickettsiales bacterium]|jgi:hypothetical protein|nr:hypothetical protein [Rickettsiales bacterium]
MSFLNYRFLNVVERKFGKILRKHYNKRQTRYNLKLVRAIYINLASRYGMTARELYRCLPLNLKIDPELDSYAFGVCQVRDYYFKKSKFFKNKMVNCSNSTICLQKTDVTSTTFIHEFGHYLRYLIGIMVALFNNSQAINDFNIICSVVGSSLRVNAYTDRRLFINGFTTEEEELFARSWEQYMKDGVAPSKEYIKLFKDFRMDIVMDGHHRDERKKFENYEDLSDSFITPEKKKFFSELIVGKKLESTLKHELLLIVVYTAVGTTILAIFDFFLKKPIMDFVMLFRRLWKP